ncbi:MAG: hypothetical protein CM15mP95_0270 [Alphaproteobacteria bacterium]|nr:MAG: hypothetical protein CM15mP95_0270 [Alphaproteobacteria bacterium]
MTQTRRLNGGLIDRQLPLDFEFDGRKYAGYQGIHWPLPFWQMVFSSWVDRSNITVHEDRLPLAGRS